MSSDRELTRIVQSWLEDGVNVVPDRVLNDVIAALPATPQRRPLRSAWRTRLMNVTFKLAAAVAVIAVAVVGMTLYFNRSGIGPVGSSTPTPAVSFTQPVPSESGGLPTPSSSLAPGVSTTPSATPGASTRPPGSQSAGRAPWVLFHRVNEGPRGSGGGAWAMRADGTGARPVEFAAPGINEVAWSRDGRRLLAVSIFEVFVAPVREEIGPFVTTGFNTGGAEACFEKSRQPMPCQDAAFDWAPDGQRIVFVQRCTYELPGCYFLTVLDLTTGERTEIYQSPTHRGGLPIELPAWSPDGTKIAFAQARPDTDHKDLWVINGDGTGLRQIVLPDEVAYVEAPRWSADGDRIAFTTANGSLSMAYAVNSDPAGMGSLGLRDIRPVGGASSCCPEWLGQDQWLVQAGPGRPGEAFNFYAVADQGDRAVSNLLVNLEDALGRIEPPGSVTTIAVPGDPGRMFLWQPGPEWWLQVAGITR